MSGLILASGGGGAGTLTQILANGNTSSGRNISMSNTDAIFWGNGAVSSNFDTTVNQWLFINSASSLPGGVTIDLNGNVLFNAQGIENATNATKPWQYLSTCNGVPNGTPTRNAINGMAAVAIDRADNRLYAYYGGAWNNLTSGGTTINVSPQTTNLAVPVSATGTLYTTTGAAGTDNFTLPAAAIGLMYGFLVNAAQTLQVTANGADTIRVGTGVSSSGGNISNPGVIGSVVWIVCGAANSWFAMNTPIGTWTPA